MKHISVLCSTLALCGSLLIGCGSDGGGSDGDAVTTSTTAAASSTTVAGGATGLFTPDELGGALLTAGDLGPGWTETQRMVFTTREPENPSLEDSLALCPEAQEQADQLGELRSGAGADVEFDHQRTGTQGDHVRQQAWSDANVAAYYQALSDAIETCSGKTWTDPDGNAVTLELLGMPPVGDESVTFTADTTISGPDGKVTWRSSNTVGRFDTVLMSVGEVVVTSPDAEAPISTADWQATADLAAAGFTELTAG